MRSDRVAIIGAGVGGLVAAALLAARGVAVTVLERAAAPGGKLREIAVDGRPIDSGPTVFTMRSVFEEIFAAAGGSLAGALELLPLETLARHGWTGGATLDLFADAERSADAIGVFAGAAEARGYRAFCDRARAVYDTLEGPFIRTSRPGPLGLALRIGPARLDRLRGISPFTTLARALRDHFADPRLLQLFGRYATYCGSSPYAAPATLMLVAHVEREGVWLVRGGMARLAEALADLARANGATIRTGADVAEIVVEQGRACGVVLRTGERIAADAVLSNADAGALPAGLFGPGARRAAPPVPPGARALSARTWSLVAETDGFPLLHHTVFFSDDYEAEFQDIGRGRSPRDPTVYVCAQDRGHDAAGPPAGGAERLFLIANAPAHGLPAPIDQAETRQCEERTFRRLARCGLEVRRRSGSCVATGPAEFEALFPGTGGALYGPASHGWMASFRRPGSASRIPGLYLAGGSTHPGPGLPMAALSGQLAAARLMSDLSAARRPGRASTRRWRPAATPGGMSTP